MLLLSSWWSGMNQRLNICLQCWTLLLPKEDVCKDKLAHQRWDEHCILCFACAWIWSFIYCMSGFSHGFLFAGCSISFNATCRSCHHCRWGGLGWWTWLVCGQLHQLNLLSMTHLSLHLPLMHLSNRLHLHHRLHLKAKPPHLSAPGPDTSGWHWHRSVPAPDATASPTASSTTIAYCLPHKCATGTHMAGVAWSRSCALSGNIQSFMRGYYSWNCLMSLQKCFQV